MIDLDTIASVDRLRGARHALVVTLERMAAAERQAIAAKSTMAAAIHAATLVGFAPEDIARELGWPTSAVVDFVDRYL